MRALPLVASLLMTALLAGCADPLTLADDVAADRPPAAAPESSDVPVPGRPMDAEAAAPLPTLPLNVLLHKGFIKAGAAFEVTDHWQPSEEYTRAVWESGFNLDIVEVPQTVEVRLDWTGTARIMMMGHPPEGANRDYETGWAQYFNPRSPWDEPYLFPQEGPLCLQIPGTDLATGHFHWMAHSQYAVDVGLLWTITSIGGRVEVPPGLHGHPTTAEEVQNGVESDAYPGYPAREWFPCQYSGEIPEVVVESIPR